MLRAAATPMAMPAAAHFATQRARTPRKAHPKAMPQGAPICHARAQNSSPEDTTSPGAGERAHMATVCLNTTRAGGGPAPAPSSPRTPQHAPMQENQSRNRQRMPARVTRHLDEVPESQGRSAGPEQ